MHLTRSNKLFLQSLIQIWEYIIINFLSQRINLEKQCTIKGEYCA